MGEQNSNVMLPNWTLILEIKVSVDLEPELSVGVFNGNRSSNKSYHESR